MLTALRQIGAWSQSGKRLKVVDEMGLVEIAGVQREVCPPDGLPSGDPLQHLLKAQQAAVHFRRESDGFLKQGDEALGTQAKLCSHLRDGAPLFLGLERGQCEHDSGMRCLIPGDARQEEAFEDTHPLVVRLGRPQLLTQIKGGGSENAGKINDLVGKLCGRHPQKRTRTAWLEADTRGRHQGGCINGTALRKGTVEDTTIKALKLVGSGRVRNPKCIMAQVDHHRHPAIGKAAFPGVQWCIPFVETESLNICRKGGRRQKALQDSQDEPPIDGDISRYPHQRDKITEGNSPDTRFHLRGIHCLQYIPVFLVESNGLLLFLNEYPLRSLFRPTGNIAHWPRFSRRME